jgi:hypothetical protein
MAKVLLFHHTQELTPSIISFADIVRRAGQYILPICLQVAPSTVMPTRSIV